MAVVVAAWPGEAGSGPATRAVAAGASLAMAALACGKNEAVGVQELGMLGGEQPRLDPVAMPCAYEQQSKGETQARESEGEAEREVGSSGSVLSRASDRGEVGEMSGGERAMW